MAQKPLPTLHVSDLGEDSCASKRHVQGSIMAGGMALENLDPESQPSALEPFQLLSTHEVRLQGTSTLGRDQSGCHLFKWGKTKPKLGPFPSNPHLKCLRHIRRRTTFTGIFAGGISVYVNGQLGLAWSMSSANSSGFL